MATTKVHYRKNPNCFSVKTAIKQLRYGEVKISKDYINIGLMIALLVLYSFIEGTIQNIRF